MQARLSKGSWIALDLLFPPRCAGCNQWGSRYCSGCYQTTTLIRPPICERCGDPLAGLAANCCQRCQETPPQFLALRSWALFQDPLKRAIHKLKYKRDLGLFEVLAVPLAELMASLAWKADLVAAVPLDRARWKQRGYNQSGLLARYLSWNCGLKYIPRALEKIRPTLPQVDLEYKDRIKNVAGAFEARENLVRGKSVLVVDDVATTGSTINACAIALHRAHADRVYGITLARSAHL